MWSNTCVSPNLGCTGITLLIFTQRFEIGTVRFQHPTHNPLSYWIQTSTSLFNKYDFYIIVSKYLNNLVVANKNWSKIINYIIQIIFNYDINNHILNITLLIILWGNVNDEQSHKSVVSYHLKGLSEDPLIATNLERLKLHHNE